MNKNDIPDDEEEDTTEIKETECIVNKTWSDKNIKPDPYWPSSQCYSTGTHDGLTNVLGGGPDYIPNYNESAQSHNCKLNGC